MPIGTAKKSYYKGTGSRFYAGTRRFPHQNRSRMDSGNLASAARHCNHRRYRHNRFPYLEAQA